MLALVLVCPVLLGLVRLCPFVLTRSETSWPLLLARRLVLARRLMMPRPVMPARLHRAGARTYQHCAFGWVLNALQAGRALSNMGGGGK